MKKSFILILVVALVLTMVPAAALAAGTTVNISTAEQLAAAIASQAGGGADDQTWVLASHKTFDLTPGLVATYSSISINGGTDFIFPITANNLTIKGGTGTVITSSKVVDAASGGNWHWQNFITLAGNNVTLDSLTLIANNNQYYWDSNGANKIIEVLGSGSYIKSVRVEARGGGDFAGSIYYSNAGKGSVDKLENVYLSKGRVSLSGKNDGTLIMSGVTIDFSESLLAAPDFIGFQPRAGVAYTVSNSTLMMSQHRIDIFNAAVNHPSLTLVAADEGTDVSANVNPVYTITIPAVVNLGTLIKDNGTKTQEFDVAASGAVIEAGAHIDVAVQSTFKMSDGATPATTLNYSLYNTAAGGSPLTAGAQFASFSGDGVQDGRVTVDTGAIVKAGSYSGTMVFTITYNG